MKKHVPAILAGTAVAIAALLLTVLGNPANMGFCIACFIRDIAGACKLHSALAVQYVRPEVPGLVLGAFIAALVKKEFRPMGGSSPFIRFILGAVVMIGALIFLGCPLRMVIRLGGGDLNALLGLAGFIFGIFIGVLALKRGFSLGRAYPQLKPEGAAFPAVSLILAALALLAPGLFLASAEGPGSMHAPALIALAAGLAIGALAQRTRLCMVAGIRDTMLFKDAHMLYAFIAMLAALIIGNVILGKFNPGFEGQPVAHTDGLWNFLGMTAVGWGSVLLGGCPLRQLILAGEGSSDSAVTVLGLLFGAAVAHNFSTASSGAGTGVNGPAAGIICFVILVAVSIFGIGKFAHGGKAK